MGASGSNKPAAGVGCSINMSIMLLLLLQVNPFGKVPAMQDGELCLFESGALLTYLADY
jgi:hypothetical protein